MPSGKLVKYDPSGFGFIAPDANGDDIFVHMSDVASEHAGYLVEGERLDYRQENGDKGPVAKDVKRSRAKGVITTFHEEKGYGFITPQDGTENLFFHYRDIAGDEHPTPQVGDEVEYSPWTSDRGPCAQGVMVGGVPPDNRSALEKYADLGDFDRHIEKLAELAEQEPWDYQQNPTGELPILFSYIHNTFERLEEEGKIHEVACAGDSRVSCFNTGLVTPLQEEVLGLFECEGERSARGGEWRLKGFFQESAHQLRPLAEKPPVAEFITDPAGLIYDWRLGPPRASTHHIIDMRRDRFPKNLQENPYLLKSAFDSAVQYAIKRVRRNYKTAVPQFYEGRVELLLPLCLVNPQRADLALPVRKERTSEGEYYSASTVLTLDWAYRNARLLAKPDSEWLTP